MHRLRETLSLEFMGLRIVMKQFLPRTVEQKGSVFFVAYLEQCHNALAFQADFVLLVYSRSPNPVMRTAEKSNCLQSIFVAVIADDVPDINASPNIWIVRGRRITAAL